MGIPQTIFLILVVTACLVTAGCVLVSGTSPVPTAAPATSVPAPEPSMPLPTAVATSTPREVVTVIRYVSLPRDLKDSKLLFTLQAPAEWNVSTYRIANSDTSDYRTDLVAGGVFSVSSYPSTRSREQEYRDRFRQWSPAPVESTATINNIRYDRFESSADGNTTVAYLADTNSANERGYASVLIFVARDSNRFEREDFERVVSSFRYFGVRSAGTIAGEEIPHYDLSGKPVSGKAGTGGSVVVDSSDWDTAGSGSSGTSSSSGSSSAGGSTGGGGCHRG
jgi:uncharacterized membrane protein YgcG